MFKFLAQVIGMGVLDASHTQISFVGDAPQPQGQSQVAVIVNTSIIPGDLQVGTNINVYLAYEPSDISSIEGSGVSLVPLDTGI